MYIFIEIWAPNHDFGQHLHWFRAKPIPDLDLSWSKVPSAICNLAFLIKCASLAYLQCPNPLSVHHVHRKNLILL